MNLACLAAAMLSLSAPGDAAQRGETVLLDFRADWCAPCRQMDPIVGQLAAEGYPVRRVNVDQERALANRFDLRKGIPCFVMLVDGREVDRVVGVTDRTNLEEMFRRNGVSPAVKSARGQSPDANRMASASAVPFPATDRRGRSQFPDESPPPSFPARNEGTKFDRYDSLIRASVRLKIEDNHGNSVGSGTIIDARAGEALIITCGHVFREAAKGGRIWVDLFGPGAPQRVPGKLLDFDLEKEVGLISIATSYPVKAARLAPPGYAVHKGDSVVSIGCDGGADASAKETRVTALNRYVGASNLHVAFEPVQGRSGGGLFTREGFVVGVCYAADPEYKEGAFAALQAIMGELDRAGLAFVYREGLAAQRVPGVQRASSDAAIPDSRLAFGPERTAEGRLIETIMPTSAKTYQTNSDELSAEEKTTLDLLRDQNQPAELICLVRPRGNSQGKREILVLDRVPPGFFQQIANQQDSSSPQTTPPAGTRMAVNQDFSAPPAGPPTRRGAPWQVPASPTWMR